MPEVGLNVVFPDAPIVTLDKPRKVILKWFAWKHLEGIYGSFLAVWSALYRLTNSTQVLEVMESIPGLNKAEVEIAAKALENQGPIMDDIAKVLWAGVLQEARQNGEGTSRLTIPFVEDQLEPGRLHEYLEVITKAVINMSPTKNPPNPAPNEK